MWLLAYIIWFSFITVLQELETVKLEKIARNKANGRNISIFQALTAFTNSVYIA